MINEININTLYDEYNKMLNSNKYISRKKYDEFINKYKETLSDADKNNSGYIEIKENGYDLIDKNNKIYLDEQYIKYKNYFENMYKGIDDNIKLDEEQIKAILADEDYALIIAGAGTGKTTTMTSKVKYLVDIKGVDPSKILVMSYTKKATMELEERIVNKFNIPACVTTFHSLGYKYIKQIFKNRKCIIVDSNEREKIFLEYFKQLFEEKEKIKEIITLFKDIKVKEWYFSKYFLDNYELYNTYDEFFESYKKSKINEAKRVGLREIIDNKIYNYINSEKIRTIRGEFVKSVSEATIANFLFTHGIKYEYEKVYDEIMDDNSIYKPDFTLELGGQEVYLEYFGLDDYRYNVIKKVKEDYHQSHHNKYISLDRVPLQELEAILDKELINMGFVYNLKTDEEIYNQILSNNPLSQLFPFKKFIYNFIEKIELFIRRDEYQIVINNYIDSLDIEEKKKAYKEFYYINEFYRFYQNYLYGTQEYRFDYSDLLHYSNKYINEIPINSKLNFDYIIIDEYQDISKDRYELAKKTADKNNSKVFAVGDDWQSIYAFSGSRIDYIYRFNDYFKSSKMFRITNTYRNSQELIDTSGDFIMKNKSQISKTLISNKHILNPIKFVMFDSTNDIASNDEDDVERFKGYQEYKCLENLILEIHEENPNHSILVVGRTNKIVNNCFKCKSFKDDLGTKISFVGYEDINLEGMTIHKSKGLTFDEVIIIGLNNKFPSSAHYDYWLVSLFKNPVLKEMIPFAEERRLFYVALTRTKNNVYLLVDKNSQNRSPFIDEIHNIINNKNSWI